MYANDILIQIIGVEYINISDFNAFYVEIEKENYFSPYQLLTISKYSEI